MIPALKSEFRKLLTVRSTYFLSGAVILLVLFIGGYITGYRIDPQTLNFPYYMRDQVLGAVGAMSILIAITCVLIFGHEYRYNTIIYTVTLNKSRSKVLAAKAIVTSVYALIMGLIVVLLVIASTTIGVHLHGYHLISQTLDYGNILSRALFTIWAFSMLGLIVVALLRNLVASVVLLLLLPTTLESILTLLLKENAKYLPFTATLSVVNTDPTLTAKPLFSATVATAYIIVAGAIAWLLFLRRDAN